MTDNQHFTQGDEPLPAEGLWGPSESHPPRRPASGHRKRLGAAVMILAGAALGGVGIGHAVWQPSNGSVVENAHTGGATPSQGSGTGGTTGSPGSPSAISAVQAGLVNIYTTLGYQSGAAAGTGMVLDTSGLVLTNNHVINGATHIRAVDVGNGRSYDASVVGYDTGHDVAVLRLANASNLATVSIGDSSTVAVGDVVHGIGNAGGVGGTPSVADGTVTALDQAINAGDQGSGTVEHLSGLIQTNAPIQPGDSGGPLVNDSGLVIGIDTAGSQSGAAEAAAQGYAIPINQAVGIVKQITAGKASSSVHIGATAFLGVQISRASSDGLTVPGGGTSSAGAIVAGVVAGSPADNAGITNGSDITAVDGVPVPSPDALQSALARHVPGDHVAVQWNGPSGQAHSATVRLSQGPAA